MSIRIDRLNYFASDTDADAFIVAIGAVGAGVVGMTATKVLSDVSTAGTLVVTSAVDPNLSDGGLAKANSGQTVNKTITDLVGVA